MLPLACAGVTSPTHLPPDAGYGVTFSTAEAVQRLQLRAVAIDGHMACEPEAEGNGNPACGEAFTTRITPGRHYLQIQVIRPGESGHVDAEQRVAFEAEGHYQCVVRDVFTKTKSTAIDDLGYPEPHVECTPGPPPAETEAAEGEADPDTAAPETKEEPTSEPAEPAPAEPSS